MLQGVSLELTRLEITRRPRSGANEVIENCNVYKSRILKLMAPQSASLQVINPPFRLHHDTEQTERLHIDFAKDAYRVTSHKDEYLQTTT